MRGFWLFYWYQSAKADEITALGERYQGFSGLGEKKGFTQNGKLAPGVKARAIDKKWLKADFHLGHGHAMAIFALLKGTSRETGP
jgi:hypothetical protein